MKSLGSASPIFKIQTPEGEKQVDAYSEEGLRVLSDLWTRSGWHNKLSYEVTWLGVPIIQLPEDILMLQEIIWQTRPTRIVETGVAHGGALVLYASMLEMLGQGQVVGVDIEIRKHNRLAIESHPMSKRITLVEGSSIDPAIVDVVKSLVKPEDSVMVALDSNHSRDHVKAELELYAPMVTADCFLVVFDTVMPAVHDSTNGHRSWEEDNPLTAITEFLARHPEFRQEQKFERLGATYCGGGFLRRLRSEESA